MYKMKRRFWSLLVPYIIFSTMGYLKVLVINSSKINGGVGGGSNHFGFQTQCRYGLFVN